MLIGRNGRSLHLEKAMSFLCLVNLEFCVFHLLRGWILGLLEDSIGAVTINVHIVRILHLIGLFETLFAGTLVYV